MPHIRPDIYKAVADNNIGDVIFQDPFTEEARKAKRNLVAASFAALLIAALELQVSGFLGLQTTTGTTLASGITKGLACLIASYFLASFVLAAFVDYSAWKFRRERVMVKPYLDLVAMLEAHFHTTGEQVMNATHRLDGIVIEHEMLSQVSSQNAISEAKGQLAAIETHAASLHDEFKPLLEHWSTQVARLDRLSWRLRARFLSLWLLDIAVPLLLAGLAIWKTSEGLTAVWSKVAA